MYPPALLPAACRCVSLACWEQVYGDEPLEPGEIDPDRKRAFSRWGDNKHEIVSTRHDTATNFARKITRCLSAEDKQAKARER